jgi:aminomethyltransferase
MSLAAAMAAVRRSVALADRAHVVCLRLSGARAWDALDRLASSDLYLRDLQLRQTLFLGDDGLPLCDVTVGSHGDSFLIFAEGASATDLVAHVRAAAPGGGFDVVDLSATHTLLGIDGPFAWQVMVGLEGPDLIGFPHATFYQPRPDVTYLRAGKTGEYGYELLVPHHEAAGLRARILEIGAALGLREVDADALSHAALENWFFDVREPALRGLTPVELQLQWRLATEDKEYVGRSALRVRPATARITAVVADAPLRRGDPVRYAEHTIGEVVLGTRSLTLDHEIGLALIALPYAHSGVDRYRAGDVPIRTVSAPFVNNLSLYVNPQVHTYAEREAIAFPGHSRARGPWMTR